VTLLDYLKLQQRKQT